MEWWFFRWLTGVVVRHLSLSNILILYVLGQNNKMKRTRYEFLYSLYMPKPVYTRHSAISNISISLPVNRHCRGAFSPLTADNLNAGDGRAFTQKEKNKQTKIFNEYFWIPVPIQQDIAISLCFVAEESQSLSYYWAWMLISRNGKQPKRMKLYIFANAFLRSVKLCTPTYIL